MPDEITEYRNLLKEIHDFWAAGLLSTEEAQDVARKGRTGYWKERVRQEGSVKCFEEYTTPQNGDARRKN